MLLERMPSAIIPRTLRIPGLLSLRYAYLQEIQTPAGIAHPVDLSPKGIPGVSHVETLLEITLHEHTGVSLLAVDIIDLDHRKLPPLLTKLLIACAEVRGGLFVELGF